MTSAQQGKHGNAAPRVPALHFPLHLLGGGLASSLPCAAPQLGHPIPHLLTSKGAAAARSGLLSLSQQTPPTKILAAKLFGCQGVILLGLKLLPAFGWVLLNNKAYLIKQSVNFRARAEA